MTEDISSVQRAPETAPDDQDAEAADTAGSAPQHDVQQARVVLIGRAGSGKTALARALFGAQNEPTATGAVARYQDDATPVIVDDLPGWVNGSENSLSTLFSYLEAERSADIPLVAIWYALDAVSARVTDYELQLIRRFAQFYPVVIVLTRTDLVAAEALAAMQSAIDEATIPNSLGVIAVAADPLPALGVAPYGVAEVVALTSQNAQGPHYDLPEQPSVATEHVTQRSDQLETPVAPKQDWPSQTSTGAQRAAPRHEHTPERAYEQAIRKQEYGSVATEVKPPATLIAVLVVVSLALALLLLGRRRWNS